MVVRVGLFGDLWDLEIEFRTRHRAQYTTATAQPVTFSAGIQEWWFSIKPLNLPKKALLMAFHCVSPWEDTSWTYSKRQMTIRCTDQRQRYIQHVDMWKWATCSSTMRSPRPVPLTLCPLDTTPTWTHFSHVVVFSYWTNRQRVLISSVGLRSVIRWGLWCRLGRGVGVLGFVGRGWGFLVRGNKLYGTNYMDFYIILLLCSFWSLTITILSSLILVFHEWKPIHPMCLE